MYKFVIMLSILALPGNAYAQDSIDSHGFYLSPSDGDIHDPMRTWSSERHEQHSFGLNVLGEYAYRPIIRYSQFADQIQKSYEVRDMAALNMGLFYSPHERLALTVTSPAYLAVESDKVSSGVGIGDFRVSVPVGLLLDKELKDGLDLSVSLVPHVDIPGFYRERYFRSSGISGGGVAVGTLEGERWTASVNFGTHFAPKVDIENLNGNERLVVAASASYAIRDDLAVRGEFNMFSTLTKNEIPWSDTPAELTGSLRGNSNHSLGWTVGASTALTRGVGAATFRAFAGLDVSFGARERHVCGVCQTSSVTHIFVNEDGTSSDSFVWMEVNETPTFPYETVELSPGNNVVEVVVPSCPKLVEVTEDEVILLEPIYFDFDQATIRFPDSSAILAALVDTLHSHPELKLIEVAGHTDERGGEEYNQGLSQARVQSVVDYLSDHGIDSSRMIPVGYGETQLLNVECGLDEDCHEENRRVEFRILERD